MWGSVELELRVVCLAFKFFTFFLPFLAIFPSAGMLIIVTDKSTNGQGGSRQNGVFTCWDDTTAQLKCCQNKKYMLSDEKERVYRKHLLLTLCTLHRILQSGHKELHVVTN